MCLWELRWNILQFLRLSKLNFWRSIRDSHLKLRHSEFPFTLNKHVAKSAFRGPNSRKYSPNGKNLVKTTPLLRQSIILRGKTNFLDMGNSESSHRKTRHILLSPFDTAELSSILLSSVVILFFNIRNLWNLVMALVLQVVAIFSNFEGTEGQIHSSILEIFSRISE
jgi:hypothetical protein